MPEIDGYDSFERIGVGGTATVWKARQISLDRPVAIKIMTESMTADDESIDQIQSEARIAGSLNHQGIVKIYDAFYRNGLFCFVMEYIDGETLTQHIVKKHFLPENECLRIAGAVADALDYAWKTKQIVHCDIKPDNIMLDKDGVVKVTDMGLSRGIGSIQTRRKIREQQGEEIMVYGTPSYVSPEQAMGTSDLHIQTDMYSLGATLYHMATGVRLFKEETDDDAIRMQVTSCCTDPMDINPSLSLNFCDFMERLLSKKPEERYPDWISLMRDIGRVASGLGLEDGPLDRTISESTIAVGRARASLRRFSKIKSAMPVMKQTIYPTSGNSLKKTVKKAIYRNVKHMRAMLRRMSRTDRDSGFRRAAASGLVALLVCLSVAAVLLNRRVSETAPDTSSEVYAEKIVLGIEEKFASSRDYTQAVSEYEELLDLPEIPPSMTDNIRKRKKQLEEECQAKVASLVDTLAKKAAKLYNAGQTGAAVDVLLNYNGEFANESEGLRQKKAKQYILRLRQENNEN